MAEECAAGDHGRLSARGQVDVQLATVSGASTPGQWRVCINHTRSGSTKAAKVPSGKKGVQLKQKVLRSAINRVVASAPTPGIVVGDLNLTRQQVQEVADFAGQEAHSVRFVGGLRGAGGRLLAKTKQTHGKK